MGRGASSAACSTLIPPFRLRDRNSNGATETQTVTSELNISG